MASTYTTSLQIQQIGNGEQSGTWGTTTNTNWTLIEQAVAGVVTISMSNTNYTLSVVNGASDEARNMTLLVGGSNSAIYKVVAPLVPKLYNVVNNTSGGYAITVGGASGAYVTIPNGVSAFVYCDGTNFYPAVTGVAGAFTVSGALTLGTALTVSNGGTGATSFTSGNLVKGAGTGALAPASASDIVTAIGSTPVAQATLASTAGSLYNGTSGWSVTPSGTKLYFSYNGTNVGSLDSSGNFIALASVTGNGTP